MAYHIETSSWGPLAEAGLAVDSTLRFADLAGFRCGVCYEFPVFDLAGRRRLELIERPLIAMECSVIDSRYMGLGTGPAAFAYLQRLRQRCQRYGGDFVLLWHNHRLIHAEERALYESLLDG